MNALPPRRYIRELCVPFALLAIFYVVVGVSNSAPRHSKPAPVSKIEPEKSMSVPAPEKKTPTAPVPGQPLARSGDEIVVCGQLFHTGTPVILWMDPGGYDAYRVESHFAPFAKSDWEQAHALYKDLKTPNRYGLRKDLLSPDEIERVRGGGWDLPLLQRCVDQFVLHYDVAGSSQACFKVLHDVRCLSVHFMLDVDGTIYQTLDLKERAWHATTSNSRSVGIEIANIGAYPDGENGKLDSWYSKDEKGDVTLTIPGGGTHGIRTPNFAGHPIRNELIEGTIQGVRLHQYDLTQPQYDALIKLTATLCTVFPKLKCACPRDEQGALIPQKLDDDTLEKYQGVLGHYHLDTKKVDPGPALQWDRVIEGARKLMDVK